VKGCPQCGYQPPTPIRQPVEGQRPGGRQVSFQRGVRILAGFLADEGLYPEERAYKVALRVLGRALPAKQRHPRKRPTEWREAA
jgi:hypothetical protein